MVAVFTCFVPVDLLDPAINLDVLSMKQVGVLEWRGSFSINLVLKIAIYIVTHRNVLKYIEIYWIL